MPLFTNNMIIGNQDYQPVSNNQNDNNNDISVGGEILQPVNNRLSAAPIKGSPSEDHHILIVDGKEKKVSKHSSYLLDMLTIGEQ